MKNLAYVIFFKNFEALIAKIEFFIKKKKKNQEHKKRPICFTLSIKNHHYNIDTKIEITEAVAGFAYNRITRKRRTPQ